jgi:hypothetical protein
MAGDRTSAREAATTLRALVAAIEAGELTAPALLVARLEGAIVALEAPAVGRQPTAVDFLGRDALHDTVLHFPSETDLARFQTTRWSCYRGSSALLVQWLDDLLRVALSDEMATEVAEGPASRGEG